MSKEMYCGSEECVKSTTDCSECLGSPNPEEGYVYPDMPSQDYFEEMTREETIEETMNRRQSLYQKGGNKMMDQEFAIKMFALMACTVIIVVWEFYLQTRIR